jgi:hypothetical protein
MDVRRSSERGLSQETMLDVRGTLAFTTETQRHRGGRRTTPLFSLHNGSTVAPMMNPLKFVFARIAPTEKLGNVSMRLSVR